MGFDFSQTRLFGSDKSSIQQSLTVATCNVKLSKTYPLQCFAKPLHWFSLGLGRLPVCLRVRVPAFHRPQPGPTARMSFALPN